MQGTLIHLDRALQELLRVVCMTVHLFQSYHAAIDMRMMWGKHSVSKVETKSCSVIPVNLC